eukprot:superscaffoldBa00010914_g24952
MEVYELPLELQELRNHLFSERNNFFSWFTGYSTPSNRTLPSPSPSHKALTINGQLVTTILSTVNPHKASGPDRLRGKVLKDCSAQLSGVCTKLFQCLLDSGCVP